MNVKNKKFNLFVLSLIVVGMVATAIHDIDRTRTNSFISLLAIEAAEAHSITAVIEPEIVELVVKPVPVVTTPVQELIVTKATEYGIDPNRILAIASCESNFNPARRVNGYNPPYRTASGLFMFIETTWSANVDRRGFDWTLDDRMDADKATDMAAYLMSKDMWSHWACDPIIYNDTYCAIRPNDTVWCE